MPATHAACPVDVVKESASIHTRHHHFGNLLGRACMVELACRVELGCMVGLGRTMGLGCMVQLGYMFEHLALANCMLG